MNFDDKELLERDPLIDRVLIGSDDLQRRVRELGRELSSEYGENMPILISILKGGVVFLADLMRCMSIHHEIDFMSVSSYEGGTTSTGRVRILKDLDRDIAGRDVLLVEDIVDSGLTLAHLLEVLGTRQPRSLRICTLLNKPDARKVKAPIDYVGFDIPNEFVIGYGLDYNEKYRNLPFIGVMKG